MSTMIKVVRYIGDIPIDIYTQIPTVMYESYKNTLRELNKYADKLVRSEIEKPPKGSIIKLRSMYGIYSIYKSKDDPFDVEYRVTCRFKTSKVNEILSALLKKKNLAIDIHQFVDKNLLFNNIAMEFSHMLNKKISIEYDFGYIKIIAHILFDVEDKIITI